MRMSVDYNKYKGMWRLRIRGDFKDNYNAGYFDSKEEALERGAYILKEVNDGKTKNTN